MTVFFTADLHFGHEKLIEKANRPFANVKEMDDALVNNWLEVVCPKDTVYILGDFAWKVWYFHNILPALPGNIILVPGNHDEKVLNVARRHVTVAERIVITKVEGYTVVLCHYPLESWYNQERHVYHLHGHLHGQTHHGVFPKYERRFDVGVDNHGFYPVTLGQLRDAVELEKWKEKCRVYNWN